MFETMNDCSVFIISVIPHTLNYLEVIARANCMEQRISRTLVLTFKSDFIHISVLLYSDKQHKHYTEILSPCGAGYKEFVESFCSIISARLDLILLPHFPRARKDSFPRSNNRILEFIFFTSLPEVHGNQMTIEL